MIMSKTPLRVSLVGGGTDLPSFYENNEYGCVVSMAINRHIYIAINNRFDEKTRISYSRTELVDSVDAIENDRVRECFRHFGIENGLELFFISDIPKNLGLGGSSAFTVGITNTLYRVNGVEVSQKELARDACIIEIDKLNNPIGKQDQYATALGGLNYLRFNSDGSVENNPIPITNDLCEHLLYNLFFIYLHKQHDASQILADVNKRIPENNDIFLELRDIAEQLYIQLLRNDYDQFADLLGKSWALKKLTSSQISSQEVDELYERCLSNGAKAGKLLGAGGGGFLMIYVPSENHKLFLQNMKGEKLLRFEVDDYGSKIIHDDQNKITTFG